jgi:hypothetical protein
MIAAGKELVKILLVAAAVLAVQPCPGQETSCIKCHSDFESVQDSNYVRMVQEFLSSDIHHTFGLSCQDCHGGNPDPKLADDMSAAMNEKFEANPFHRASKFPDIPEFCGRCHSDINYMRRFKPGARVDQLGEYWTSQHGKILKAGDTNGPTCINCHGVHNIRAPADRLSSVYRTAVAETCRKCHSDSKRMGRYQLPNGSPLPINQYDLWRRSVHANAMLAKDDLSAPTCNNCHGNHGVAPPQVASILFVCEQCHGREAGLFRNSPKEAGFKRHNVEYLTQMGKGGCAECHDPPEPSASITNIRQFSQCVTCHGNHGIVSPSVAMLGPLPATPCRYCHEALQTVMNGLPEPEETVRHYQSVRDRLLAEAQAEGLSGDARFDWLIDQALRLPFHRTTTLSEGGRPHEFTRLFQKFRLGKTYFTYIDPKTGQEARQKLIRCTDCHGASSKGFQASSSMLNAMHGLAVETARADRTLLAAQRGGVEVRQAQVRLDKAVDSQIQLEALLHTFSVKTNGAFAEKQAAGMKVANESLSTGLEALKELSYRHRGLLVSLYIILCVLIALGLKIRELSRRETKR